jgi:hypothetical protein
MFVSKTKFQFSTLVSFFVKFPKKASLDMQNALVEINDSLALAFANQDQAKLLLDQSRPFVLIDVAELEDSRDESPAMVQHVVHKMKRITLLIQEAMETHKGKRLILCQDPEDQSAIQETALICGAFAILVEEWDLHAVVDAFPDFAQRLMATPGLDLDRSKYSVTVLDCWQALLHARERCWMSWRTSPDDDDQPLLVDEIVHYADPANGGIHILAPGGLLLFPNPVDLPDGALWAAAAALDGAPRARLFAAAFYVDLLPDLGVRAVASLDPCRCATAAAAFAAAGLAAVDLPPAAGPRRRPSSPLRALDALLTLTRGAGGAVALHAGGGGAPGTWPEHTAVVVAAYLVGREGFAERAAYAWLLLLCPWLLAAPAAAAAARAARDTEE